jgi:rubrerythrin
MWCGGTVSECSILVLIALITIPEGDHLPWRREMSHIAASVREAIKTAIQLEKDGKAFFDQATRETSNDLGKKMFRKLASDEVRHLQTFKKMFQTIADPQTWKQLMAEGSPGTRMLFFEQKAAHRTPAEKDAGELSALQQALEVERKAIAFFKETAQATDDPEARRIFEAIAREEEAHYDLIQAQIDSVTHSGFWFDIGEFQMDGMY